MTSVEPLHARRDTAVLLVDIAGGQRVVVKLSGPRAEFPVDYERTALLTALARSTGAPVHEVLAAASSPWNGRWSYLLAEHIDGVPWQEVRPHLEADQVAAVHRQLAAALLAVQSAGFPAFGELDRRGQPPAGQDVLGALHRRVDLRVRDERDCASFHRLLEREATHFTAERDATLCHDDLHHGNLLCRPDGSDWRLVGLLDWDKAWAGPAESDVARMAFWDDMTGPAFWEVYRASVRAEDGAVERALIYRLLWCLDYDDGSARHTADTARLRRRLDVA